MDTTPTGKEFAALAAEGKPSIQKREGKSNVNRLGEQESQITNNNQKEKGKIKRGLKPRSQRNRKRPRSDILSNDDLKINAEVVPLQFEGKAIMNGSPFLRIIEPYVYTFTSHAKARWIGRSILDVYVSEFGSYPQSYYEAAIKQGRILVSDEIVDLTYKIKGHDILCHRVHRHEPAVAVDINQPPYVRIVGETDTVLAVDKPSTLPVHPCGGYHRNSLMPLLESTYTKLYTIHRLDRLTSGLTILGKTSQEAQSWGRAIAKRENCEKLYLARVKGHFPRNIQDHVSKLNTESQLPRFGEWVTSETTDIRQHHAYGYWVSNTAGEVKPSASLESVSSSATEVDQILANLKDPTSIPENDALYWLNFCCPVRVVQPKRGICEAGQFADISDEQYQNKVKPAQTSFKVVYYDSISDSTVVLCRPETGRTHQIRLHLQHLGHSIANDPNYGGDLFFGNENGRNTFEKAKGQLEFCEEENKLLVSSDTPATLAEVKKLANNSQIDGDKETLNDLIKRTCVWCSRANDPTLEFLVRSPGIWLHALQYTITTADNKRHSFQTDVPRWASPRE